MDDSLLTYDGPGQLCGALLWKFRPFRRAWRPNVTCHMCKSVTDKADIFMSGRRGLPYLLQKAELHFRWHVQESARIQIRWSTEQDCQLEGAVPAQVDLSSSTAHQKPGKLSQVHDMSTVVEPNFYTWSLGVAVPTSLLQILDTVGNEIHVECKFKFCNIDLVNEKGG